MDWELAYIVLCVKAAGTAVLEDGRKFKAALNVYSELNIYMDMVFSDVEKYYMTPSITDKEKAEKAAWYISTVSEYEIYNSRLDIYKFKIEKRECSKCALLGYSLINIFALWKFIFIHYLYCLMHIQYIG